MRLILDIPLKDGSVNALGRDHKGIFTSEQLQEQSDWIKKLVSMALEELNGFTTGLSVVELGIDYCEPEDTDTSELCHIELELPDGVNVNLDTSKKKAPDVTA